MGAVRAVVAFMALGAAILGAPTHAAANKVGVAAAVNPDAFSGGKEIRIGKSIFYNERISTDANGVVQVLLVDGSTFTVGKNSNVVIDKFVYDPNKKTGEIVTSFSKGSMRFIGGKISKNPGGVTVNTPDGSLAIRGGMAQGTVNSGNSIFSFLYGKEMTYTSNSGQTYVVYQNGYTLDLSQYPPQIRPTTPADTARLMASLTNSSANTAGASPNTGPPPGAQDLAETLSMQQLIIEATSTRIDDEVLRQLQELQNQATSGGGNSGNDSGSVIVTTLGGYGAASVVSGSYDGEEFYPYGEPNLGISTQPTDLTFNASTGVTTLTLLNIFGNEQSSVGRAFLRYGPTGNPNQNLISATIYNPFGQAYRTTSGTGFMTSEPGYLCNNCDFIKWGSFYAGATYDDSPWNPEYSSWTDQIGLGWWTAANITAFNDLPRTGTATYSGSVVGQIVDAYTLTSQTGYGDLGMTWNFANRKGTLTISDFDVANGTTPLNVSGTMTMPGVVNRFSGNLNGTVGPVGQTTPAMGGAYGSFAKGGNDPAAGVVGAWHARTNGDYRASGVFGGRR